MVLLAEKLRTSPLYVLESNERVKRISRTKDRSNVNWILHIEYSQRPCAEPQEKLQRGPRFVKMYLNDIFHYFTSVVTLFSLG